MKHVLDFLAKGDFHSALVELYGLGCAHDAQGCRNFDAWSPVGDCPRDIEESLISVVANEDFPRVALREAELAPLVLLREIERRLCESRRYVASTRSECLFTDSRGDTRWLLRRRSAGWSRYPASQSPNARHFLSAHTCIPAAFAVGDWRISIERHVLPATARPREKIAIRVSHFTDSVDVDVALAPDTFRVTGLKDESQRLRSFLSELDHVRADKCDVWVAPEYASTPTILEKVSWSLADAPALTLQIAVPGSYAHFASGSSLARNRATALSSGGAALFHSDKLTELTADLLLDGVSRREHIEHPQHVDAIDTPLGLVAVLICKDFCDDTGGLVRALWDTISPDWMLIPAMGDAKSLKAHRAGADHFCRRHGSSVVVANQETGSTAKPESGFVQVAFLGDDGKLTTIQEGVGLGGCTITLSSHVD